MWLNAHHRTGWDRMVGTRNKDGFRRRNEYVSGRIGFFSHELVAEIENFPYEINWKEIHKTMQYLASRNYPNTRVVTKTWIMISLFLSLFLSQSLLFSNLKDSWLDREKRKGLAEHDSKILNYARKKNSLRDLLFFPISLSHSNSVEPWGWDRSVATHGHNCSS